MKRSEAHIYYFIRKSRFRKKKIINKMAMEVMIDKTTAVYLALLGGYVFASLFIFGDVLDSFQEEFLFLEANAQKGFWVILTALPIRYIFKSFRDPGILFSSTEYQLTLLPYSRGRIWFYVFLEKLVKQFLILTLAASLVILLTPISAPIVVAYLSIFLLYEIVLTVPQWVLFQKGLWIKIGWLLAVLIINGIGILTSSPLIGLAQLLLIIVINHFLLSNSIFNQVQWSKVTEVNDFQIWKMFLISAASKTKFKRQKKFSIFQKSARTRKPFQSDKAIHNRLWRVYLAQNAQLIFQVIGAFTLMLTVFIFMNDTIYNIGVAVVIYAYASVAGSFFNDRMRADILEVLPWNLESFKRSYFKWVAAGACLILIPIIVHAIVNFSMWTPMKVVYYACVFLFLYHLNVNKTMTLLARQSRNFQLEDGIGFLFLIAVAFSGTYPALTFGFVIVLLMLRKQVSFLL
ncbi:hypothetical protein SAMN05216238_11262 [Lentibacillus persicus]|uniref:Uncharacterized protein n=1 Tax=Lentibacillus persicus TaxID=640948 RepID=A0A1I1ZE51_9BACI|nr:hypothetical protein [Lentibacillus persicus]SFE29987.1 hypothetical protein SAMN05216238_11262 [Lentibacillus persicus]